MNQINKPRFIGGNEYTFNLSGTLYKMIELLVQNLWTNKKSSIGNNTVEFEVIIGNMLMVAESTYKILMFQSYEQVSSVICKIVSYDYNQQHDVYYNIKVMISTHKNTTVCDLFDIRTKGLGFSGNIFAAYCFYEAKTLFEIQLQLLAKVVSSNKTNLNIARYIAIFLYGFQYRGKKTTDILDKFAFV